MLTGVSPQIESILAAGNHGYSNMNCQPWRFRVTDTQIDVIIDAAADTSPYNFGDRYSYFAVGTLVENMSIAASALGYSLTQKPSDEEPGAHMLRLELVHVPGIKSDPLAEEVFLRTTNRKRFLPLKLTDPESQELRESLRTFPDIKLAIVSQPKEIAELAEAASVNDELVFSNQACHAFFFDHINWKKEDDEQKRTGLYVRALELAPTKMALLYLLQNWSLVETLSGLQFNKIIAGMNKPTYAAAGAFGGIVISKNEPQSFINAGRAFERLWLTVTKIGLNLEPLNGLAYLKLATEAPTVSTFSTEQTQRIETAYSAVKKTFGLEGTFLAAMFRVGGGASATVHSTRRNLEQIVNV